MHAPLTRTKHRVLVLDSIAKSGITILEKSGHSVLKNEENPTAILVRSTKVFPGEHPDLVAIARAGAGTDNIDVAQATARGIPAFYAPGQNANSVYELVFIGLGMYARKVPDSIAFRHKTNFTVMDASTFKGVMAAEKRKRVGFELLGKTLGVIGLGHIGRLVANGGIRRGMRVIGYDPALKELDPERFDVGIELAQNMTQVLRGANVISLHVPVVNDKALIGAEQIDQMLRETILINYARGELVDEDALLDGLDSGKVRAYLTDFPSLRTVSHPKVQWTEHLGASTEESEERCAVMAARQLDNYLKYGIVENAVNFPNVGALPRMGIKMRLAIPHRNVPGQLALIMDVLAKAGANVGPQQNDTKGEIGYCVVDLEEPINDEQISTIKNGHENIIGVRVFRF